jgi:hypothetical protein
MMPTLHTTGNNTHQLTWGMIKMIDENTDSVVTADIDTVNKWIEKEIPLAEAEAIRKYDKDYSDGAAQRELRRLKIMKEILDAGIDYVTLGNGCVYIQEGDKTFRYYLLTGKWSSKINPDGGRVSWRSVKVYLSKSATHFVENYVKAK